MVSRQFFDDFNESKLIDETPRIKRRNERISTEKIYENTNKIVLHPLNYKGKYPESQNSSSSSSLSESSQNSHGSYNEKSY